MLKFLYILCIIVTAGTPLWLTILLIIIGSKNKHKSCDSEKEDDYETPSTIAVISD